MLLLAGSMALQGLSIKWVKPFFCTALTGSAQVAPPVVDLDIATEATGASTGPVERICE